MAIRRRRRAPRKNPGIPWKLLALGGGLYWLWGRRKDAAQGLIEAAKAKIPAFVAAHRAELRPPFGNSVDDVVVAFLQEQLGAPPDEFQIKAWLKARGVPAHQVQAVVLHIGDWIERAAR